MGGINCPPPLATDQTAESKRAYIASLAEYCEHLFGAAAKFYEANSEIERSVRGEESLSRATQTLMACRMELVAAQSALGTVSSVIGSVAGVDFVHQLDGLASAQSAVLAAELELKMVDERGDLQEALWSRSGLTESFVEAMRCINAVTTWQGEFTKVTSTTSLFV